MKRFWLACGLLLLLLAGSLANACYAQHLTQEITAKLEHAQLLVGESRWDRAQAVTEQTFAHWQKHHFYLHTVMRHSETDQILRSFGAVFEYLHLQELDQYVAANADLIAQLELLAEMEQPSLVNVL